MTNFEQRRTRDGRFASMPAAIPTSNSLEIPSIPTVINHESQSLDALYERLQNSINVDSEENWANTYHLRFKNFNSNTIEATKDLFALRPSTLSFDERVVAFKTWSDKISDIYSMERPAFYWDEEADYGGGGFYRANDHSITMSPNHPSVVTLIHETRHALQIKEKGAPMITDDIEKDARAWSLSLYYKTKPNLFKRLVSEGKIFHINPSVFN